jgi:hypothetical protein
MSSEHRRIVGTLYTVNYQSEISVKAELEALRELYEVHVAVKWLCTTELGVAFARVL